MKGGKKRAAARVMPPRRTREDPLTVFVHIPKTAGTTFAGVLRDNFHDGVRNLGNVFKGSGGFDPGPAIRLADAPELRTRDVHVLTGHLPFGIRDRLPADARYITFLRDPVERTLSQYYGLLKLNRRRALPGDGSLEAVLGEGEIIYDNLQTRMLSDSDEPVGDVDDGMLEQAKENLRSGFTAFGLVEHFDESLVLFRRLLGLRTIIYIQQRVATRPRGSEVPQEAVRLAERFNRHDMELYRWAREQFEQMVTDEEIDFAADVAALQTARGGGVPRPSPVEAADAKALWELLVRTRSELFVDHRDRARAEVAGRRGDTSRLLESLDHRLAELSSLAIAAPLAVEEAPVSEEPPTQPRPQDRKGRPRPAGAAKPRERPVGAGKDRNHPAGAGKGRERPAEGGNGRVERPKRRDRLTTRAARVAESRDHAVARLEDVQARLQALESRPGVSVESERLREEAANLQRRVDMLSTRCAQISSRLGATAADDADGGDPTAG